MIQNAYITKKYIKILNKSQEIISREKRTPVICPQEGSKWHVKMMSNRSLVPGGEMRLLSGFTRKATPKSESGQPQPGRAGTKPWPA
jgi:hypothetical protein